MLWTSKPQNFTSGTALVSTLHGYSRQHCSISSFWATAVLVVYNCAYLLQLLTAVIFSSEIISTWLHCLCLYQTFFYWNALYFIQLSNSSVDGGVWCCERQTTCNSPLPTGAMSGGIWDGKNGSRGSHQSHDCLQQVMRQQLASSSNAWDIIFHWDFMDIF